MSKIIKVSAVFLFCVMFSVAVNAQDAFAKGDKVIQAGIGVGSTLSGYGGAIPINASFEMCIKDNLFDEKSSIGVGGYFAFASYRSVNFFFPGVRGAFHYQFIDKLDTYAGLMMGIRHWRWADHWSYTDFIIPFFAGARYYFTDNIGAFAELGYGIAAFQFGVSFKF